MGQKKKSSPLKVVGIILLIIALLAGIFIGARKFRTSNTTANVVPVSQLNGGYMEDSMSIDGMVYDMDSQTIYPDVTQVISDVYVTQGQEVKVGDKLMAYDMASQQLTLQLKQIAVEKARSNITVAQAELNALYNTTPVAPRPEPSPSPSPSPEPEPDPLPTKPDKKQVEEAWNYLDEENIDDYYLIPREVIHILEPAPGDQDGRSEDSANQGQQNETDETGEAGETGQTGEAGQEGTSTETPPASGTAYDVEIPEEGSIENPYRYLVTEDGVVYGSFLNEFAKKKDAYAMVEIREGNVKEGNLLAAMTLNSNKIKEQDPDAYWYVILRADGDDPIQEALNQQINQMQGEQGENQDDSDIYDGTDFFDTDEPMTYTAEELAAAIEAQKRSIQEMDLNLRRLELDLKILTEEMEDGYVVAKRDGIVTLVHDKNNPPLDGSPFLKVDAGSGVTVRGTISELLLAQIQPGQPILATNWEDGSMYEGTITKIDDYPADNTYYYGGGNPNSSQYGFLAYFDDASDLNEGHYLQMSLDVNANKEEAIYLPIPYIRNDAQGKYVMKDDNGYLTKQYIKCGKSYYGMFTEVTEGISNEDLIAFPYGSGAEEGAKTEENAEEEVYY